MLNDVVYSPILDSYLGAVVLYVLQIF